jgi:glutamate synthase (ferredoxin)
VKRNNFEHLFAPKGLYRSTYEHDSCGTGFVARVSGEPSHDIVEMAVQAVINLTHRGAVSSDSKTGDGAGIQTQIPQKLFIREAKKMGIELSAKDLLGVAMIFLPSQDKQLQKRCIEIIEESISEYGLNLVGWRIVPVDRSVLGDQALETCPDIRQALILPKSESDPASYERALYFSRKKIERIATEENIEDLYISSMSQYSLVYKGLFVAPQLKGFYEDLTDPDFESALALFHQRYSTNTFPTWDRAQPMRYLGHNGEINTIQGNRNWLRAREPDLSSPLFGENIDVLKPVTFDETSDSGSLDHALELLVMSGRDVLHSMMMLIPEPWENMPNMDPALKAFYEYHASLVEPWDGPAAISFTDGRIAGAILDRNGLRPARYKITRNGLVIMASEVGVVDIPDSEVIEKGQLGPGQMIAVDTVNQQILRDRDIKNSAAHGQPYSQWVSDYQVKLGSQIEQKNVNGEAQDEQPSSLEPIQRRRMFGYTAEELNMVIKPMILEGKDATFSMGDDTPLAALSSLEPITYNYFKQKFAQVTNPAIDNLREAVVMSSYNFLGARGSFLEEKPDAAKLIRIDSPVLTDSEVTVLRDISDPAFQSITIPVNFNVADGTTGLRDGLSSMCETALEAIDAGKSLIILSDREISASHAPIPMMIAVGRLHHFLIDHGKRMKASIIAETAEPRDIHHYAALIGYGANAVNPYMAFEIVRELFEKDEIKDFESPEQAVLKYRTSASKGILKIMSKMGISTVTSYSGAQIFEAIGLDEDIIEQCFRGTPCQFGGMGLNQFAEDVLKRHAKAMDVPKTGRQRLEDIGFIRFRRTGEYHGNNPQGVRALHAAVLNGNYDDYKVYSEMISNRPLTSIRDLMEFKSDRSPVSIDAVESVDSLRRHLNTGSMSLGALSPEAHETIALAMNSIGAASATGEGGEDPVRYRPRPDGLNGSSKIKQVASARFGVTPEYLAMSEEIEIKIAQGSKPGEGGQLPGHKVVAHIAQIRHSQPGITLISPPPHHDIYSIEDLAQLIYDLKIANPRAYVTVKLVSEAGVGTIAAGVTKGFADKIVISGHAGGTGASPLSSIKNAGTAWELGVAETQQVLVMNDLRGRVRLRTDGGFQIGRDVVVAAMLGAEEYGFGTNALIAAGCEMARQCHLNTCPVGIATQREDLREKFNGTVESIVHYFTFIAQEIRETLAELGYKSLDEIIGRSNLLTPSTRTDIADTARMIDVRPIITLADPTGSRPIKNNQARNDRGEVPLDDQILKDVQSTLDDKKKSEYKYDIHNTDRTVGGRVGGELSKKYGSEGLPEGSIDLHFIGTAGQSFGAWCANGMRLTLVGEANDYVGKGLGGGEVILKPSPDANFKAHENSIMGNTCLYGATGGYLFAAGRAGERFCVRASGVQAVVEGVGDHGCEYMTSGIAVILGKTGRNFGAGMSGGMAFVYDPEKQFPSRYNPELLALDPLDHQEDQAKVRDLVERHTKYTGSSRGQEILDNWESAVKDFWKVIPFQIKDQGMSISDVLKKVEGAVT